MFRLEGRTALITGTATGIGRAISLALASNGADIVITDRRLDALDETESLALDQGGRVFKTAVDVHEQNQIRCCVANIENSFGPIDILVKNGLVKQRIQTEYANISARGERRLILHREGNFLEAS